MKKSGVWRNLKEEFDPDCSSQRSEERYSIWVWDNHVIIIRFWYLPTSREWIKTEKMATSRSFSEADLLCPVCRHIYMDPVMLPCNHSLCKVCFAKVWQKKKSLKCPLCKKRSSKTLPPPNVYLKTLTDRFRQDIKESAASEICQLHKENLKLFCLEDEEPVCVVCRDSKTHTNHRFRPLDEAAQEHRVSYAP